MNARKRELVRLRADLPQQEGLTPEELQSWQDPVCFLEDRKSVV